MNSTSVSPPKRAVTDISCGRPPILRIRTAGPADAPFSSVTATATVGRMRSVSVTTTSTCTPSSNALGGQRDLAEDPETIEADAIAIGRGAAEWLPRRRLELREDKGLIDVPEPGHANDLMVRPSSGSCAKTEADPRTSAIARSESFMRTLPIRMSNRPGNHASCYLRVTFTSEIGASA